MKAKLDNKGNWEIEIFDKDNLGDVVKQIAYIKGLANDIRLKNTE